MHTKDQIELSKQLAKEKLWMDWWKKRGFRGGDWAMYGNAIILIIRVDPIKPPTLPTVTYSLGKTTYKTCWAFSRDCIPLPSWSDCREFLREQGWRLQEHTEIIYPNENDYIRITLVRYNPDIKKVEWPSTQAPNDLEAIQKVCQEVCHEADSNSILD